jgi:phosphoglycolate phosphatase-like HAD superfamily hydrolase
MAVIARIGVPLTAHDTIWYIGDRAKDVAAALRADPFTPARIVPIGYGLHAAGILLDHHFNRDHLVLSYEDWYPVVEGILAPVKEVA